MASMIMKKALLIFLVISIVALSGCWNRRELKSLSVSDSVVYDLKDDGTMWSTIEIIKPQTSGDPGKGGSGSTSIVTWSQHGNSVPSMFRQSSDTFERKIYFAHLQARMFSEKFAENDVFKEIDLFIRDQELRQTSYLFVIRGDKPEQVYEATTGFSSSLGSFLDNLAISNKKANSTGVFVQALEFMRYHYEDGREPVMGVLEIQKNEQKETNSQKGEAQDQSSQEYILNCAGLAAFKGEKLVGFMNGVQSRAYNFITNNAGSAFIPVILPDGNTIVEVMGSKAKIKTSFKDDVATIDVTVSIKLDLTEEDGKKNLEDMKVIKTIEETFNNQMKAQLLDSVNKAQKEFNSDIFGFGSFMHEQNPKDWKKIKDKWNDYFGKCKVNVTVKSSIIRNGEIKQAFKLEE